MTKPTYYAVRIVHRLTEDCPRLAYLMYAHDLEGPWFDMASGDPDHMWDILDAFDCKNELIAMREMLANWGISFEYHE